MVKRKRIHQVRQHTRRINGKAVTVKSHWRGSRQPTVRPKTPEMRKPYTPGDNIRRRDVLLKSIQWMQSDGPIVMTFIDTRTIYFIHSDGTVEEIDLVKLWGDPDVAIMTGTGIRRIPGPTGIIVGSGGRAPRHDPNVVVARSFQLTSESLRDMIEHGGKRGIIEVPTTDPHEPSRLFKLLEGKTKVHQYASFNLRQLEAMDA